MKSQFITSFFLVASLLYCFTCKALQAPPEKDDEGFVHEFNTRANFVDLSVQFTEHAGSSGYQSFRVEFWSKKRLVSVMSFERSRCNFFYNLAHLYKPSKNEFLYHNIDTVVGVGEPFFLSVSLSKKREMSVSIGDHAYTLRNYKKITRMSVSSGDGEVSFKKIKE